MHDDGWTLRYTLDRLVEAMRQAERIGAPGATASWSEDDFAECLDTLCHFAPVPGFDDAYSWLAGAHLTVDEKCEVRALALRVSDRWHRAGELNG